MNGTAAGPQLDPQQIEMLRGLRQGTLLPRLAATYLQQAVELIEGIRSAAKAADRPAVQAAAHSLKSASFSIGAKSLGELSLAIESLAGGRGSGDLGELVGELEPRFAALLPELRALI